MDSSVLLFFSQKYHWYSPYFEKLGQIGGSYQNLLYTELQSGILEDKKDNETFIFWVNQ